MAAVFQIGKDTMRSFVAFRYGFRTLFHPVKERLFTDLNQPAASERRKTGGVNQFMAN